jgi:hypothetical protein
MSRCVAKRSVGTGCGFNGSHVVVTGIVSFSDYRQADAHSLAGAGYEERQNLDVHYNGQAGVVDWDVEGTLWTQ